MVYLPIILKVIGRDGGEAAVATESGHLFRMPVGFIPESAIGGEFALEPPMLSDTAMDGSRPAMARALINEIIGAQIAPPQKDAKTRDKIG